VKQSIFAVAGLLVAALAMPSQEATALVLPDIIVHTQVVVNPDFTGATNLTQFTTGTSTLSIDGVSAAATANIQPSPNQTVTASVDGLGQAIANTHLQYYFAITGPSGVEVPIIITASGEITPPRMESPLIAHNYILSVLDQSPISTSPALVRHQQAHSAIALPLTFNPPFRSRPRCR
jgi:hypothetical protein